MANFENLKKAFNHILLNVDESDFCMSSYREWGNAWICLSTTHECNTVGCIIGHCSILDSKENFYKFDNFGTWSQSFFEIYRFSNEWFFLFTSSWSDCIQPSTKEQALLRLAYFIDFQKLPDGFWKPSEIHNYELVMPVQELKPYIING